MIYVVFGDGDSGGGGSGERGKKSMMQHPNLVIHGLLIFKSLRNFKKLNKGSTNVKCLKRSQAKRAVKDCDYAEMALLEVRGAARHIKTPQKRSSRSSSSKRAT